MSHDDPLWDDLRNVAIFAVLVAVFIEAVLALTGYQP